VQDGSSRIGTWLLPVRAGSMMVIYPVFEVLKGYDWTMPLSRVFTLTLLLGGRWPRDPVISHSSGTQGINFRHDIILEI